ncbi:MAG: hypothetical protein ACI3ZR_08315, partial [bacterium]
MKAVNLLYSKIVSCVLIFAFAFQVIFFFPASALANENKWKINDLSYYGFAEGILIKDENKVKYSDMKVGTYALRRESNSKGIVDNKVFLPDFNNKNEKQIMEYRKNLTNGKVEYVGDTNKYIADALNGLLDELDVKRKEDNWNKNITIGKNFITVRMNYSVKKYDDNKEIVFAESKPFEYKDQKDNLFVGKVSQIALVDVTDCLKYYEWIFKIVDEKTKEEICFVKKINCIGYNNKETDFDLDHSITMDVFKNISVNYDEKLNNDFIRDNANEKYLNNIMLSEIIETKSGIIIAQASNFIGTALKVLGVVALDIGSDLLKDFVVDSVENISKSAGLTKSEVNFMKAYTKFAGDVIDISIDYVFGIGAIKDAIKNAANLSKNIKIAVFLIEKVVHPFASDIIGSFKESTDFDFMESIKGIFNGLLEEDLNMLYDIDVSGGNVGTLLKDVFDMYVSFN